jgi:hypothetical protein
MTTVQILALVAVVVAVLLTYVPLHAIRMPAVAPKPEAKPNVMQQIESIVAVREAHTDKVIVNACNALLQAMLQVTK